MLDSLLKSKWIPVFLQVLTLVVFIGLVCLGWGITSGDSSFLIILRNTNLANLVVWSFWWPAVIIASILFGWLWCMVCPMELVQSVLNRVGLNRRIPPFLRTGWLITVMYAVVLVVGVHTFAIHRAPHRMALYMLTLFGLTVVFSLIFEKRAFCTYACPVGHLLGLYSTVAPMEWRVKDRAVCDSCEGKPCVNKSRDRAWYGRACQSYLFPGNLRDNRDCILCTQCMKACPHDNVTFRPRKPFADLLRGLKLSSAQLGFLMVVLGFAFYEVTTEWGKSEEKLLAPFKALNASLHITRPWSGTLTAFILFLLIPFGLYLLVSALQFPIFGRKMDFDGLSKYAVAFIPLVASTHFAKAVIKSISRLQYIPGALKDTEGVATAKAIQAGTLSIGGGWQDLANTLARGFGVTVMLAGLAVAIYFLVRYSKEERRPYPVLYILLAAFYTFCTAGSILCKILF